MPRGVSCLVSHVETPGLPRPAWQNPLRSAQAAIGQGLAHGPTFATRGKGGSAWQRWFGAARARRAGGRSNCPPRWRLWLNPEIVPEGDEEQVFRLDAAGVGGICNLSY